MRFNKGKSVKKHIRDYCVLDLETTGVSLQTLSVIEISALRVRDDKVTGEFSTLVNPGCRISPQSTAVNNITDDMVAGAPYIHQVLDSFMDFVGNDILLGYNLASFDINIIYDLVQRLRGQAFSNDYLDLYYCVRRCLKKQLPKKSLEKLCCYYGVDNTGEHRALVDCYLTKMCYDKMYQDFGEKMFLAKETVAARNSVIKETLQTQKDNKPIQKKNLWW